VRRLAKPVTVCDGHGVFFMAASGQIRMATNIWLLKAEKSWLYDEVEQQRWAQSASANSFTSAV